MSVLLWVISTIGAAIIGLLVSVFFDEPLKKFLTPLIVKTSVKKRSIAGTWVTTFTYNKQNTTENYIEVIELHKRLGVVIGRVVPDARNYPALRLVEKDKPIRLRGEVFREKYLTGVWFHPIETDRFQGSFQLIISNDKQSMSGKWLGFSESKEIIDSGDWEWKRAR